MPASRKNLSGMVRFDKYNLPHDSLTFSNGNIGNIEHLMLKLEIPAGGGSTAIKGALKKKKKTIILICMQFATSNR